MLLLLLLLLAGAAAGCSGEPVRAGAEPTTPPASTSPGEQVINPAAFAAKIDNPYLPLVPGTRLRYRSTTTEGSEELVVEVTHRARQIMGIRATVVRHSVTRDGRLAEDVLASYAQDRAGNVWYLGEDVKEYENGKVVTTKGSWRAGDDGAKPGIIMEARPRIGDRYRHENYPGKAEDSAEVLSLDERVSVPAGTFDHVLMTKDYTPLEPDVADHKYYARGVGIVLEVTVKGPKERRELVEVARP